MENNSKEKNRLDVMSSQIIYRSYCPKCNMDCFAEELDFNHVDEAEVVCSSCDEVFIIKRSR